MAMDDDMQTFRQKTGRKSGCHGCKYADWDADGATCKLDGLNVWNPAKGCKYRKAQSVTNGDMIRQMTDEELAAMIANEYDFCSLCAFHNGEPICTKEPIECSKGFLEWLRKEAEP